MTSRLVLASSSPRRLDLLGQLGIRPSAVVDPAIDEAARPSEQPRSVALRLAIAKRDAVISAGNFVLAADTIVAVGRRCMPKPADADEARTCLALLCGRRHRVFSAVAVRGPDGRCAARVVTTVVGFARLPQPTVEAYLAAGEWEGKAGGYAIQGRAAAFIDFIAGSYSGVVGLPLHETMNLLNGLGWQA